MLLKFLPLVLMFIIKRPKLWVPALAIGGVWYFFFGGKDMLSGGLSQLDPAFSLGATLDPEKFDKAEIYEPLASSFGSRNSLPSKVSLKQFAPTRRHQGQQGSCVGWASAYAARSILEARATGRSGDQVAFSPAYLYNQIALSGCNGAYMLDAMKAMINNGALPYNKFGYDPRTCSNHPDNSDLIEGQQFKIKGFNRLTQGNTYNIDMQALKQNLAQGAPVVIGMQVGGSFMSSMVGKGPGTLQGMIITNVGLADTLCALLAMTTIMTRCLPNYE